MPALSDILNPCCIVDTNSDVGGGTLSMLPQLCADPADCAEGARVPVANRTLDDDSRVLLEFRRKLGDPVSL